MSSAREVREETSCYVDSRPSSSVAMAAPPDISCSPIISPDQEEEEEEERKRGQEKSKEGQAERKNSTSTPLGTFSSHHKIIIFFYERI